MSTILLAIQIVFTYKNFYLFFFQKLGLLSHREHIVYKLRNGMQYKTRFNTTDFAILNETVIFKEYFKKPFFDLQKSSVVFDFGGQAGDFAVFVAYTKKCDVYVFEPDADNFALLKENIALNNLDKYVHAYNYAVTNTSGKLSFYVSDHSNKGVHSEFYRGGNHEVQVDAKSLSDVIKDTKVTKIDFLKIDIEGGEHEIVKQENTDFFDIVQNIAMEYHCQDHVINKQPLSELVHKLVILGFEVVTRDERQDLGILYATKKHM